MTKRKYPTEAECAEWGRFNKVRLKKRRLKPSPRQLPAGQYWQGQGFVSVYDVAGCIPIRPYREPTERQRAALAAGRELQGTRQCAAEGCRNRIETAFTDSLLCVPCEEHTRCAGAGVIAQRWLASAPLILDTETTGLEEQDEIIEIALIDATGAVLLDTLVQPVGAISGDAMAVHGITDEMVRDVPTFAEIMPDLVRCLDGREVIIYNAGFDTRLLLQSAACYGMASEEFAALIDASCRRCLMKLYAEFHGEWNDYYRSYKWQSLETAAATCGIVAEGAHRALQDCRTSLNLVHHIAGYAEA
jgi:DNA polymerase-3 subunit epsilon